MLKPLLDRNYALGINKLFFHVYTHNPWMNHRPGMTLDGIGLFFQRDQTWWEEGKSFVDYITRCQTLLQYGHPVADIAVFTGEEMPRRSILPERLCLYGCDYYRRPSGCLQDRPVQRDHRQRVPVGLKMQNARPLWFYTGGRASLYMVNGYLR